MTTTPIVGSENRLCRVHRRLAHDGGVGRHEVASDALGKAACVTGGTGQGFRDRRTTEKAQKGARMRSCLPGAGLPVIKRGTGTRPPRETGAGGPTARGVHHAARAGSELGVGAQPFCCFHSAAYTLSAIRGGNSSGHLSTA